MISAAPIIFIFGLIIGSFLNAVIYRLHRNVSFLKGRSYCPYCNHTLAYYDLVPLFSFIFLGGHCRYCEKKISWQYPLVELATAILFLSLFWGFGSQVNVSFVFWAIMVSFLVVIFVSDLKWMIIPDRMIYGAIGVSLIYRLFSDVGMGAYLLSAFFAALFFSVIVFITKGKGMGIGDIKLAFLIGLLLGYPLIIVALFSAFLIGSIVGMAMILARVKTFGSEVPFGPFLILGLALAALWGQKIAEWYLDLIAL